MVDSDAYLDFSLLKWDISNGKIEVKINCCYKLELET